jgi:hypothetical protein
VAEVDGDAAGIGIEFATSRATAEGLGDDELKAIDLGCDQLK